MTEAEKKMKKYCTRVERNLNLPRDVKARVMTDFASAIQARREAGMTDEEIFEDLGTPKQAAATLNEQMKEYAYRKSPWRFLFAALAVYGGWELIGGLAAALLYLSLSDPLSQAASVGIIGGADGPTAIFVTTRVPELYCFVIPALLLAVGIWGFVRLRKCKQK